MIEYLEKNGKVIPYEIINKKNKNAYFRFKKGHILITKPKSISKESCLEILENNFSKYYEKLTLESLAIIKDDEIILEEKKYKILINKTTRFSYEIIENNVLVFTTSKDIIKIKKNIYKEHLLKMLEKLNNDLEEVLNLNKITKRNIILGYFKTKFGSYHKREDLIKLNIILAKFDINNLYYVLMHEYAHTIEFNHSKSFYNLLSKMMPEYKIYDKNLKKVSISL